MAKIETLDQLLVHEVGDLISAEQQLLEALPKMADAASDAKLKTAIQGHIRETEMQLSKLMEIGQKLDMTKSDVVTCKAMKGLIAEGQEVLKEVEAGPVRDAAIIGAAQRVEHYEMAAYGTAKAFAEQLGRHDVQILLNEIYSQEKMTDKKLSAIAESLINSRAQSASNR